MASRQEFFAGMIAPAIPPAPMPPRPAAGLDAPLREVFIQVLEDVGGQLGRGDRLADVDRHVAQLLGQDRQVLSLVDGVTGNRDPATVAEPHELAALDTTIAPARLAVAENGSVWISGDELNTRAAVFICQHLIAVMDERRIVGTLSEAITQVGKLAGGWGVFVSGPSKTADIEQALVTGAHGPRTMTVYLVTSESTHEPVDLVHPSGCST